MLLNETNSGSFLEETVDFSGASYILMPTPMESTATFLRGTKFGPLSIIQASRSLENYDYECDYEIRDKIFTTGELELPPDTEKAIEAIKTSIQDVAEKEKIPIMLGGEHTATYAASLAFTDDVEFVVFDAHGDFKRNLLGVEFNHASVSRLIAGKNDISLIGVRSLSLEEKKDIEVSEITVVYADNTRDSSSISKIKNKVNGRRVYISIDMDVFDPAYAPGVGTPQPNGLSYKELFGYLKVVVENSELVGFDVMETRPGSADMSTEALAAKLIMDIVSLNENKKAAQVKKEK